MDYILLKSIPVAGYIPRKIPAGTVFKDVGDELYRANTGDVFNEKVILDTDLFQPISNSDNIKEVIVNHIYRFNTDEIQPEFREELKTYHLSLFTKELTEKILKEFKPTITNNNIISLELKIKGPSHEK